MNNPSDWRGYTRALIYAILFVEDPVVNADRAFRDVIDIGVGNASPEEFLSSIRLALASDESLAELIPQGHSDEVIRAYLTEVQRRLEGRLHGKD